VSVDVLIIGAGGCGMTAALAAHAAGQDVAILEKAAAPGGNTALSSGSIPAAGSALQAAAGVEDNAPDFASDLRAAGGQHDADVLIEVLAGGSAELIDFLMSEGVTLDLIKTYRHVGHRTFRLHAPPSRRGSDLVADLERAVARRDIPLALGTGASGLMSHAGRVTGAVSGSDRIEAGAVILACNGFGAARDLLATHCPVTAQAAYGGAPHSTGDALLWGAQIGAAMGNMSAYQGHAGLSTKTGALMTWTLIERGAVIVDGTGCRFGDETLGYSGFADLAFAARGPFHMIYDARIRDDVADGQPDFAQACQMGVARDAADIATLAEIAALPAKALTKTLETAREAANGTSGDQLRAPCYGALDRYRGHSVRPR
jgi:fumarate reductase flavoprotein subunit